MAKLKGGTTIGGYLAVHTGNIMNILKARDGHGSGLDADTVDGKHASEFASSGHNHDNSYVKKTGDLMSGNLQFSPNAGSPIIVNCDFTGGWARGIEYYQMGTSTMYGAIGMYGAGHNPELIYLGFGSGPWNNGQSLIISRNDVKFKNNMMWHAGNDGSGSGLDADMIDGVQSDRIPYGRNDTCTNLTDDTNKLWKAGFYEMVGGANAPQPGDDTWWWMVKLGHGSNRSDYRYGTIIAGKNAHNELFFKNALQNGSGTWCRLWHDRNMSHGSGLDADTLDGKHWSDIENTFVKKSGDTMTGNLIINSGAEAFALKTRNSDHVYMAFYPRTNSNTRGAYIGYGNTGQTTFDIYNNIGDISLNSSSNVIYMDGIKFDQSNNNPTTTERLNIGAYVYATRFYGAVYNDYAEYFEKDKTEEFEPGDLICLDDSSDKEVYIKSKKPYSANVVGVYSDEYAQCIGGKGDGKDEENYIPIGLAGRVRVKVIGKVSKGDLLVSSGVEGYAMVSTKYIPGTVIGKALENKNSIGEGKVRMLINLQ